MKTKTISISDIKVNKLTKYGRNISEVLDYMSENGCKVIKERKEGCKSRVYLGYKNEYVSFANYSARVCRDGCVTIKHSDSVHSPIPSSVRNYTSIKFHTDKNGDVEISKSKRKFFNGKILEWFDVTRKYEDFHTEKKDFWKYLRLRH